MQNYLTNQHSSSIISVNPNTLLTAVYTILLSSNSSITIPTAKLNLKSQIGLIEQRLAMINIKSVNSQNSMIEAVSKEQSKRNDEASN